MPPGWWQGKQKNGDGQQAVTTIENIIKLIHHIFYA